MQDPQLGFLADDVLDIFHDIKGKTALDELSDETVAILAAGVLETYQIKQIGVQ
jgi:hypothetical protein